MFFTRLFDRKLAQASYIVGCQATGNAIVIDPNRDIAQYIAAAAAERLRITHVTETHIHADFMSGARELAERTKAKLLLSAEGGTDWQYGFAAESKAQLLRDGDSFMVGNLKFDAMHTPGHTPEHLIFIVSDLPAAPLPVIALTGDFVFVGDVGRPDLLEKAAKQSNTMEAGARDLWKSIAKFRALPEHLQVWPGHGAGSACGKALGAVPSSTVGYEKLVNWGVSSPDETTFITGVLDGQPEPPAYFARMKRLNRDGPPRIGDLRPLRSIAAAAVGTGDGTGRLVVDLRAGEAFVSGHITGSITIPLNRSFTTYAGSVLPYDVPLVFVAADEAGATAHEAARDLALIGYDAVTEFIPPSALDATAGERGARVSSKEAIERHAAGTLLVDVRNSSERDGFAIAGTQHIPFPSVIERASELPRDKPFLVHCQTGARSAVAASALRRLGYDAIDAGGIMQWRKAGGDIK